MPFPETSHEYKLRRENCPTGHSLSESLSPGERHSFGLPYTFWYSGNSFPYADEVSRFLGKILFFDENFVF